MDYSTPKLGSVNGAYTPALKLDKNSWITDPRVPDPDNLPEPLGYTILVRPYSVKTNEKKTTIIMPDSEVDYMNYLTNIGRVVAIGPCAWNQPHHRNAEGERFDWVKVGDFVTYPKNTGSRRKFKGVSFVILVDDEVNERLIDPQVFDNDFYKVDIPDDHYEKYNIIKV